MSFFGVRLETTIGVDTLVEYRTAPRSAKSNRKSLKDVSDEELDEMDVDQDEDQDHASPVKRKPVAKKSDDLWDVDTGDEDATMPKSNLRGATPKRGRGRGSKPSSTRFVKPILWNCCDNDTYLSSGN